MRWVMVLMAAGPVFFFSTLAATSAGLSPVWGVISVGVLVLLAIGLPDEPVERTKGKKNPSVPRLTSHDPLDPLFGTQSEFPADPDIGYHGEHHRVLDPSELDGERRER